MTSLMVGSIYDVSTAISGEYVIGPDVMEMPVDRNWWIGSVSHSGAGIDRVDVTNVFVPALNYRMTSQNGTWSDWVPIATATPPEWHDAPLEAGWAKTADVKYGKDGSGKGYLVGVVNKASVPLSSEAILRLPAGYRPPIQWPVIFTAASSASATAWSTYGYLRPDGYLRFTGGTLPSGYNLNQGIAFVAEFPTA